MKLHMRFLLFICIFISFISTLHGTPISNNIVQQSIIIRQASYDDLDAIIALDIAVSYEYFKPLLLEYPELQGKEEEEIEAMLKPEFELFNTCIAMKDNHYLFVACHENRVVGYLACHQHDTIAMLDYVMIDAAYRGMGIGKKLIFTSIQSFPQAQTCMLVVLDNNIAARTVYEKMGFMLMHEKPLFLQEKYPEERYLCYEMSLHK